MSYRLQAISPKLRTMCFHLLTCLSKSSFPVLVIYEGLIKILFTEIRPADISKIQFGIRQLIKEKIADAVFTTCTDHKLRVGKGAGAEILLKYVLINLFNT